MVPSMLRAPPAHRINASEVSILSESNVILPRNLNWLWSPRSINIFFVGMNIVQKKKMKTNILNIC